MIRKPTQRELKHLREIVGEDGKKVHYFTPAPKSVQIRHRVAAQVRQMRAAAGLVTKPKARGVAAQVAEMRQAAALPLPLVL